MLLTQIIDTLLPPKLTLNEGVGCVACLSVQQGANVLGVKLLEEDHWIELESLQVTIEGTMYQGHYRPGSLKSSHELLPRWHKLDAPKPTFQEYLNDLIQYASSEVLAQVKRVFQRSIRFLSNEERNHFKASINNGHLYTENGVLKEWQESLETTSLDTFLQKHKVAQVSPTQVPDGKFMHVLTHTNELFLASEKKDEMHHTSISRGEGVLSAGEMTIKNGKIVTLNSLSGHYKPKLCQLMNILEYLEQHGVDLNAIEVHFRENKQGGALTKARGEVVGWIAECKRNILEKLAGFGGHHFSAAQSYAFLDAQLKNFAENKLDLS